jgi:hypothetical protein
MSGSRRRPPVIGEMFCELVSSPGRAVTAGVKPPSVHHLRCGLPIVTPLRWYGESIDPGAASSPIVFLGYAESASNVPCPPITGDLLQAAGRRSDRLATPLSTVSTP